MKIVRESLFEFQRGQDPLKTLELGGKLQKIKDWLSPFLFSSQYKINPDYTIDIIRGDFIALSYEIRDGIPEYVKFNKCSGSFIIDNKSLPDMLGCPEIIEGDFIVPNNKITDLKGSPKQVNGDYIIKGNPGNFKEEDIKKICDVQGKIRT
jgi:hypothetical protein